MKFCTDIHGHQMINPNNFGDPLTFPLVSPGDSNLWFCGRSRNTYWMLNLIDTRSCSPQDEL